MPKASSKTRRVRRPPKDGGKGSGEEEPADVEDEAEELRRRILETGGREMVSEPVRLGNIRGMRMW